MSQPLDFDRMIRNGAGFWLEDVKRLDRVEAFVMKTATDRQLQYLALRARERVRAERASLRDSLRQRFSVEVVGSPLHLEARIVDKELARPMKVCDVAELDDMFVGFMTCDTAWWAMTFAYKQAWVRHAVKATAALWWYEKYHAVVPTLPFSSLFKAELLAYFYVRRNAPILYAPLTRCGEGPPAARRLQEAALGMLAAWVRARIKMFGSLKAALGEGGNPQEALLRELPGAVIAELAELDAAWSDPSKGAQVLHKMGGRGVHKYLTNRVSDRLRAYGSATAARLEHAEEQAHLGPDQTLDDFELQEAARQKLDALERAVAFSPQEARVWRRLRQDTDIGQIAAELGISKEQVSVVAHRAREKARKAGEAAGF